MTKRTRAQQKTDDLAFPIRVKFVVPPLGLMGLSSRMTIWLRDTLGPARYATHSAMALGNQAIGVHFVTLEDAQAFVAAFPELEIADGTRSKTYYAPGRRSCLPQGSRESCQEDET
ncbi:MAG: hypothetical protein MK010_09445 [Erythrobacter sp.]|nr:hypothetical protein [Erythrobacter sp.]